jgi:hypothetical protein
MLVTALPVPAHAVENPRSFGRDVSASVLINRIDLDCDTANGETKLRKPTKILRFGAAASDAGSNSGLHADEPADASAGVVEIWRRAGNYVWIRSQSTNSQGVEQATQLCFRNDGTLARIRQATSVPALDSDSAREAYIDEDGSLILATLGFRMMGEMTTLTIEELPDHPILH